MKQEDPFTVVLTEDNALGVEFSEPFLGLTIEEQTKAIREFFWEKTSEPDVSGDVGKEAFVKEAAIILAETFLNKLTRGEAITNNTEFDISLEELMTPTYSIIEGFGEGQDL